jgi:hypothetical protein
MADPWHDGRGPRAPTLVKCPGRPELAHGLSPLPTRITPTYLYIFTCMCIYTWCSLISFDNYAHCLNTTDPCASIQMTRYTFPNTKHKLFKYSWSARLPPAVCDMLCVDKRNQWTPRYEMELHRFQQWKPNLDCQRHFSNVPWRLPSSCRCPRSHCSCQFLRHTWRGALMP